MNTKIIASLLTMAVAGAVATAGTIAYFTDTATISGITLSSGSLDLKVDSNLSPNVQIWVDSFTAPSEFQLANLEPGYTSGNGQIIDIKKFGTVDGKASIRLNVVSNHENGRLGPELLANDTTSDVGELAQNIRVVISYSANNDTTWVEKYNYTLAEFAANPNQLLLGDITGGADTDGKIASVKLDWSIPTTVGNEIMTDSVGVNVIFGLEQTH